MPVFEYRALDAKGKNIKGIIDADSESQARTKLRGQGKFPVSINITKEEQNNSQGKWWSKNVFERIKSEEISIMTRQLATLLGAGIPLIQALDSLIDQTKNNLFKRVIAQIKESVNEGQTLKSALEAHPKFFSNVYINMVSSGEMSGSLDIVLERLADFAEKQEALKGRMKAALIYPFFMGIVGAAILFILITYIVPNITQVFSEMDKVLPMPTQLLLGLSDFLGQYWWLLIVFSGIFISLIRYLTNQPFGANLLDLLKLKMFITGPVVQKIILARFSSTLGSLLNSGVGLVDSMKIVRALVNNSHVSQVIDEAIEQIQKGKSMASSFSDSQWFPPMFVQMVAVGEQSGNLEGMLEKVALAYEREVETAILGMTSLIEPIMIVTMGAAVGFIVLSILLPIFEMNQMIG